MGLAGVAVTDDRYTRYIKSTKNKGYQLKGYVEHGVFGNASSGLAPRGLGGGERTLPRQPAYPRGEPETLGYARGACS